MCTEELGIRASEVYQANPCKSLETIGILTIFNYFIVVVQPL